MRVPPWRMIIKSRVLFICGHNSGRSQIAEAYLKEMGGADFHVESAGLEPAESVDPIVIEVMREDGHDISKRKPKSVFEKFKKGELYDHVVTVCGDNEDKCPIFPGITKRWHMPFPDPAKVKGTPKEKLVRVREIRDMIKKWLTKEMGSFNE